MGRKKDYIDLSEDCKYCRWYELWYVASGGSGFYCGKKGMRLSGWMKVRKWCKGFEG